MKERERKEKKNKREEIERERERESKEDVISFCDTFPLSLSIRNS